MGLYEVKAPKLPVLSTDFRQLISFSSTWKMATTLRKQLYEDWRISNVKEHLGNWSE